MSYFTERAKQLGLTGSPPDDGHSQAGESYFQRHARELGLQPAAPAQQPASAPVSNFFTNRAMDLGIIPDERHADYHNKIDTTDLTIHPKGEPVMPPFSGNTPSQAAPSVQPDYLKPQAAPGSFQAIQDFQQRTPLPEPTSAKQQFYEQEAAARDKQLAGAPGFIKKPLELLGHGLDVVQANIPGLADFQQGAGRTLGVEADTAPTTGGLFGKAANIAGQFAGGAVNPAALEQSAVTGAGRVTTGALQKLKGNLGEAATLGQRLAGNAVEGAAQNVANTAAAGHTSARDIAEAAALGGLGGAAFEAAGTGLKRLIGGKQPAAGAVPEPATPQPEPQVQSIREIDPALHATDAQEPLRNIPQAEKPVAMETPLPEPRPLPQQPSSQSLGFSAFGEKAGAYDNLRTSTKSQLVSRQKREKMPAKALRGKLYTDWVDDLHPMDRFDKEVEAVTGEKLDAADKSHTLALNSRGADVVAKQILTARQVDSQGKDIGKSLKEILAPLPQHEHSYVDFEDYLVNRHAITRMEKRGERVFREDLHWTPDEGRQILADYEAAYPQFKTMADGIDQFQRNMAQHWLVDTGLLPQKSLDQWLDENPTYVPNKRYFSELEKTGSAKGGGKKKGYGNQSAPVKGYTPGGSERLIISPIEAMIENVDAFVKAAKRNEAMQSFVKNLERDPEALSHFAELVPEEQIAGSHSLKGLNETLNKEGIEGVIAKLGEDFDLSFRKATQRGLDKDNIVRVMVGGEPKYIQVNDKPLLEAITALGPDASNVVMDFFGKVTSAFKTLTTGVNPVFSLTRNIMRDIPQAYVASKSTHNPARFMADLAQSAWAIARNKDLYQDYLNLGGGHASPAAADRNLLAQSKRQILPQRGSKLKGIVPRGYDKLQNMLNAVESAPRLGEFKRLGANAEGVAAAQDVTVNFKRRGRHGKQFDKALPYFNAAVQGLDKTVRMFKDAPPQAIAKTALAVSLPAMISYAINHNDPDYQKVSKRTKDNFYLLPKGGTFFKIAKPKELGTVFADIPERLLQVFAHQDPDAFRDFADQVRTTFTVPGVQGALKSGGITDRLLGAVGDTVGGPIADVAANQNFAGAPIVPGYLQNLSPELQSDPRTSIVAKKVGEWTGTSPKALDYLFKQYTGILGQLGQPLLSPGGSVGNTLVQQVTTDPVYSNDISEKFYDSKGKLDQAKADFPVKGELPAGYNDGLRKQLGKVSDAMSGVRKQMRDIEADMTIPAATKRKQLRDLQERINQMAQDGNDMVNQSK
ncbi:hypothetical protein GXP70_18060 [Paenibacillus lycopersici]|uniref:Large polyvalent protein associated domain-containing protein n=1 Tax=Paenibacillus lycopersici TaxID=2704462 RepID=A0A6C0G349_9BACL|nr:LPD38 domain-containing protein [Paenibacillus lycopersici]QHT61689.1 hypothetical protein GXP70_18060 [Paenibacillus lycopersici]